MAGDDDGYDEGEDPDQHGIERAHHDGNRGDRGDFGGDQHGNSQLNNLSNAGNGLVGMNPLGGDDPGDDDDDGDDVGDRAGDGRGSGSRWNRRGRRAGAEASPLFSILSGNPSRWGPAAKGFVVGAAHDVIGLSEIHRGIEALPALERERIASRSSHWSAAVPLHGATTQGGASWCNHGGVMITAKHSTGASTVGGILGSTWLGCELGPREVLAWRDL